MMTDDERLEFERLKTRVAELEARPLDAQALEAAIQGSAMEKVARLELATLPPGWDDEAEVRRVANVTFYVAAAVIIGTINVFAFLSFSNWPH